MILARFQGMGAKKSVVFALLADKTRDSVRARASAFLGMSFGVAFCLAFVLAPILSIWWNIAIFSKIFSIISLETIVFFLFKDTKSLLINAKKRSAVNNF